MKATFKTITIKSHEQTMNEFAAICGDNELMAQLRQSILEMDSGELISWQEAKQELGL